MGGFDLQYAILPPVNCPLRCDLLSLYTTSAMVALTPILALGALIASTLATPLQVQFPEVGDYAFLSLISPSTAKTYLADRACAHPLFRGHTRISTICSPQ